MKSRKAVAALLGLSLLLFSACGGNKPAAPAPGGAGAVREGQGPADDGQNPTKAPEQPLPSGSPDEGEPMERLRGLGTIRFFLERGMALLDTGEELVLDGQVCRIFALGTDRDEQFVRGEYYALGGDTVYTYDIFSDTWVVVTTKLGTPGSEYSALDLIGVWRRTDEGVGAGKTAATLCIGWGPDNTELMAGYGQAEEASLPQADIRLELQEEPLYAGCANQSWRVWLPGAQEGQETYAALVGLERLELMEISQRDGVPVAEFSYYEWAEPWLAD